MNRILLLSADSLVVDVYREQLGSAGFLVSHAADAATAQASATKAVPSAILLDLALPEITGLSEIVLLLSSPAFLSVPLFAMPSGPDDSLITIQEHRSITVIRRTPDPIRGLLHALGETLEVANIPEPTGIDSSRRQRMHQGAEDALHEIRIQSRSVASGDNDVFALHALCFACHQLAHRCALGGFAAVAALGEATESLLRDFRDNPEQIDTQTTRTLSQAVDFLSEMLGSNTLAKLRPPGECPVLAIDDEPMASEALAAALGCVGVPVTTALRSDEALATLEKYLFDLVFLDVGLPDMNGFEICTRLRQYPHHKKTPVVFLTGMPTFQNRVQSTLAGGNEFLSKPFNLVELPVKALMWIYKGQLGKA